MTKVTRAPRASTADPTSVPDWAKDYKSETKATPDQLTAIRAKADELRDKLTDKIRIEENLTNVNKDIEAIQRQQLPMLMLAARLDHIGLEPDGNLPGYDFKLKDDIYANILAEWEPEAKTRGYDTVRELGGEDTIKSVLTIRGGRGTDALMRRVIKGIQTLLAEYPDADITWDVKEAVQWNTLSSFLKELVHRGKEPTAEQKEAIGARVGKIVKPEVRKPPETISRTT